MNKKIYFISKIGLILLLMAVGLGNAGAQEKIISGTVTDFETGETLIGVNIVLTQDKSKGTVTDIDGNYKITVPATADSLNFSYVGYTSQTVAITSSVISIGLMPGKQLAEVVVVGYGTQKTREVTSAVASVKEEDFNEGNVNNPIQLIQGKVAGLSIARPGADPNSDFVIRLRGLSTFGSNTQPLIIIDGVQGASLKSVDPEDIASMDVLKDASAASIYGTKGASGVIIITTKKGAMVPGKKGANVEFSTNFTIEKIDRKLDVLTPEEYLQFDNSQDFGSKTDWMDEVTGTGHTQVYNLAINGATEASNYRVSFNYRQGDGVVNSTGFEQYNGRLNFSQKTLNDMMTLNFNLAATMRDEDWAPGDALGFIANYNPTAPVYDTSAYSEEWGGYFQRDAFSFYNPVAAIEQNIQEGKKQEIIGSLKADLKPVKWLTVSAFYSQSRGNDLKGFYTSKNSLYNATNGDKNKTHNGYARKETEDRFQQLFEITGLFEKDFIDKLNVKLLAGYSYQEQITDWYKAAGEGFLTDGFTYNNLGSASDIIANKESSDSYKKGSELLGFFSRLNLNWDDGVFLTVNFRRDGSTMFGENNKWANFPGISAGVDITRYVEIPYVNRLKVRGGYGETGNLPKDPYLAQDLWNVSQGGNFFYQGQYIQSFKPVRNPNPDLKWEVKKEIGFGIDFALLNYRLNGSIDYFKSNSTDLILEYTVPIVPPNFTDKKWLNVGEMENSGLEFVVNYNVLQSGKLKWSTDFNFTYYFSTKMVKITNPEVEGGGDRFYGELGAPSLTGVYTILASDTVGQNDIGQIIAPIYIGVDSLGNKMYKDVDGDGEFDPEKDYEIVGNGLPKWQFGWGNTFTYKNFFLNFFLRGVFGHSLVNVNNARYGDPITIDMQSGMGITTDYMNTVDGIQYSDVHVEKADFVKLDNFAIGYNYNLPENKYVTSIKFYISGQNLFTITGYSGVDPEVRYGDKNDNDNPLAPGIDRQSTYFSTRSFTAGINVLF